MDVRQVEMLEQRDAEISRLRSDNRLLREALADAHAALQCIYVLRNKRGEPIKTLDHARTIAGIAVGEE